MHILQKRIPYLFDTPGRGDVKIGLEISYVLLGLAVIWIVLGPYFGRGLYYWVPFIILSLHGYLTFRHARNILFLFRYVLLAAIGLGAALAWSFNKVILVAPFGAHYQTHEATVALVGSVMLAVAGSSIGWFDSFRRFNAKNSLEQYTLSAPALSAISRLSGFFAFVIAAVLVYRAGGFVTEAKSYATGRNDLGFEFGAFNAFFFFFTASFFVATVLGRANLAFSFLILLALYVLPILTGSRADFLMQAGIFVFVGASIYWGDNPRRRSYPLLFLLVSGLSLYLLSNFLAVWREVGNLSLALTLFAENFALLSERPAGTVVTLSTANQTAGHFYAVYAKLNVFYEPFCSDLAILTL